MFPEMPLPDYGYNNKEKKTHQDIVFEMAPEIVSDDEETKISNGKNVKRVRGKVIFFKSIFFKYFCFVCRLPPVKLVLTLRGF